MGNDSVSDNNVTSDGADNERNVVADFKIVTNTTADLPMDYIRENGLGLLHYNNIMDGVEYGKKRQQDAKEFYAQMRSGKMPTTSQVNPDQFREDFAEFLTESKQILYISFSSGLSGSCQNAMMVAREMMEEQPGIRIEVIDSLCASMGEGLLVHKAVELKKAGRSLDETVAWLRDHIQKLVHVFTVDDLNHLYRGGRVSKATAIIGTIAGIKPVLHVDKEGHLVPISKVRGRKKSLMALVDYMGNKMGSYRGSNDIVFISHGDAQEDAELVAEEIKRRFGIGKALINPIGATIGAHAGPGTIALFFMGDSR
ncbi:MAG: DegV family protein [Lachnospiraceae bacterium]|jgi:DegV family protein with EDD domain|nr:DegV family protein [Lachnospiraceae bacterium]